MLLVNCREGSPTSVRVRKCHPFDLPFYRGALHSTMCQRYLRCVSASGRCRMRWDNSLLLNDPRATLTTPVLCVVKASNLELEYRVAFLIHPGLYADNLSSAETLHEPVMSIDEDEGGVS